MPVTKGKQVTSKKKSTAIVPKRKPSSAGGLNKFVPTKDQRDMVTAMAGMGMPHERIRFLIVNPNTGGFIALNTLKAVFTEELDAAGAKVEAMVAGALLKHALGTGKGAVTAGIFLSKAKFGYREQGTLGASVDASINDGQSEVSVHVTMKME